MGKSAIEGGMAEGVVALLFDVGLPERCVVLTLGEDGSYLESMQRCVKGPVEFERALEFDGGPTLVVNKEGAIKDMVPNGSVHASKAMEEVGCRSKLHGSTVKEGDLHCVLRGPILAVGYDADHQPRDITALEMCIACRRISRPK